MFQKCHKRRECATTEAPAVMVHTACAGATCAGHGSGERKTTLGECAEGFTKEANASVPQNQKCNIMQREIGSDPVEIRFFLLSVDVAKLQTSQSTTFPWMSGILSLAKKHGIDS